jgi:hypothetical protein
VTGAAAPIHFSQGRIYITGAACDRHFAGCGSVILLRQDDDLLVLPVTNAASGGYLLKIRNAAGDRVVNGADFFRDQGLADDAEWLGAWSWSESYSGFQLYEFFRM